MGPAISKPLLSDLVARTDRPASPIDQACRSETARRTSRMSTTSPAPAGIPLVVVDLNKLNLNEPERRRKVVEAIGRACESDDGFFMVTNHGRVPVTPAGVVEGMLRVDGELFHFHLLNSERPKCYSDDPNKAAEARALALRLLLQALSESLGLDLERSNMVAAMGRHAHHMAVSYYPPCPQPDLITDGLPVHKDPNAVPITLLLQDGVSGLQVQRGGRWVWVALNPVPNALTINIGDQLQKAIGLSTSFDVRPHCYPLESFVVDQWPSNNPPSSVRQVVGTYATEARALGLRLLEAISESVPYSSSRDACNAWGENIHRAIQRCAHKLGCSSPSYCLPITVNRPSPHGSETASPFSPLFILEKNDVKVEVITNEATAADEDVSKFDLAAIAGTLSLLVPMAINIDELTTNWGPLWKVLYGIFMIMSLMSALIGLSMASFRTGSRARNLSSHCAKMSFVVATIVLVLLIASKLGCVGCVAGARLFWSCLS